MADKETVIKYVAISEYLRQSARNAAKRLFEQLATVDLLADPNQSAVDLVDSLALALSPLLTEAAARSNDYGTETGFAALSSTDEDKIVAAVLITLHSEAEPLFASRIQEAHDRLVRILDEGVDESVVEASLKSDAGKSALFVGLLAALSQTAASFVEEVERQIEAAGYEASSATVDKLAWDTVGDGNSCADGVENSCDPRNGKELTLDDWKSLGLPGAASLICSMYSKGGFSNCRCRLRDAATPRVDPSVIDVSEAVAAGKARANAGA